MTTQHTPSRRGPKPRPHTREHLIQAGIHMFHTYGYAATGIQEVVDMANIPKGSFYNHFDSKEIFGQAVVDTYFQKAQEALKTLLNDSSLSPLHRLRKAFEQKIETYQAWGFIRGCLMGNLSLEIADHSTLVRESLHTHFEEWEQLLARCIAEAQQQGEVSNTMPANQLAQFILNSWEGALLRMKVEKNEQPLQLFMEVIFKTVLV